MRSRISSQAENEPLLTDSRKLLLDDEPIDLAPSDLLTRAMNLCRGIPSFQFRYGVSLVVNGREGMLLERWRSFPVNP